jgi:DNA-directed RNA polymerase beta' subunit
MLSIKFASSKTVYRWTRGRVYVPTGLNYLTLKPKQIGLQCEFIFGSVHKGTCHCLDGEPLEYSGWGTDFNPSISALRCADCLVLVNPIVRRYRFAHIRFDIPVFHPWAGQHEFLEFFYRQHPKIVKAVFKGNGIFVTASDLTNQYPLSRDYYLTEEEWRYIYFFLKGFKFTSFHKREVSVYTGLKGLAKMKALELGRDPRTFFFDLKYSRVISSYHISNIKRKKPDYLFEFFLFVLLQPQPIHTVGKDYTSQILQLDIPYLLLYTLFALYYPYEYKRCISRELQYLICGFLHRDPCVPKLEKLIYTKEKFRQAAKVDFDKFDIPKQHMQVNKPSWVAEGHWRPEAYRRRPPRAVIRNLGLFAGEFYNCHGAVGPLSENTVYGRQFRKIRFYMPRLSRNRFRWAVTPELKINLYQPLSVLQKSKKRIRISNRGRRYKRNMNIHIQSWSQRFLNEDLTMPVRVPLINLNPKYLRLLNEFKDDKKNFRRRKNIYKVKVDPIKKLFTYFIVDERTISYCEKVPMFKIAKGINFIKSPEKKRKRRNLWGFVNKLFRFANPNRNYPKIPKKKRRLNRLYGRDAKQIRIIQKKEGMLRQSQHAVVIVSEQFRQRLKKKCLFPKKKRIIWTVHPTLDEYYTGTKDFLSKLTPSQNLELEDDELIKNLRAETRTKRWTNLFARHRLRASHFFIRYLPCLPAGLRPVYFGEDGMYASQLNRIYFLVVARSFRLNYWLFCVHVPHNLMRHEMQTLQDGTNVVFATKNKMYKTFCERIQGKRGQIRLNLLGKRVDYSARSVIVAGSNLSLSACGVPKKMLFRLFEPLLFQACLHIRLVHSLIQARSLLRSCQYGNSFLLHRLLYSIIQGYPILLNRAPTLHRLGVQSFFPSILSSKAIQLHPLVCSSFNADFDGDQMGIHLPISIEGKTEARFLTLALKNWYLPSNSDIALAPTQDMILGLSFLTHLSKYQVRQVPFIQSSDLLLLLLLQPLMNSNIQSFVWCPLHPQYEVELDSKKKGTPLEISVFKTGSSQTLYLSKYEHKNSYRQRTCTYTKTTVGRILFNSICTFS